MIAKVFVPAAAVVTIATVAAPSSAGLILAFLFGSAVTVLEYADQPRVAAAKTQSEAQIAAMNNASAYALQRYNEFRTPDMPMGLSVGLSAGNIAGVRGWGPSTSSARYARQILQLVTLPSDGLITLARPGDCFSGDFVGIHISTDRVHWTFVGVGPQNSEFAAKTTGEQSVLITPLHPQLCGKGADPLFAGYRSPEAYTVYHPIVSAGPPPIQGPPRGPTVATQHIRADRGTWMELP